MRLSCPSCGNSGPIATGRGAFERDGLWGSEPIRRCKRCQTRLVVAPAIFGTYATVVPGEDELGKLRQETAATGGHCSNCRRSFGPGTTCQFCGQVEQLPAGICLAPKGLRLEAQMLTVLLFIFTLGIGYVVWALIVYGRAQSPAKQLLGMRVVTFRKARRASWGAMLVRDWICKPILAILVVPILWILWDKNNQELWDRMMGTLVVNDPGDLLRRKSPWPEPTEDLAVAPQ